MDTRSNLKYREILFLAILIIVYQLFTLVDENYTQKKKSIESPPCVPIDQGIALQRLFDSLSQFGHTYIPTPDSPNLSFTLFTYTNVSRTLPNPTVYRFTGGHFTWLLDKEAHVMKAFEDYAYGMPDCLVVDIGANDGQFTVLSGGSGCKVIAVEVQPTCLPFIHLSLIKNELQSNVVVLNRAAHHEQKLIDLDFGGACSGTFKTRTKKREVMERGQTRSIVMGKIIPEDVRITLMKVDTEGHEPEVFEGAMNLFLNRQIDHVVVEIFPFYWTTWAKENAIGIFEQIFNAGYTFTCMGSYGNGRGISKVENTSLYTNKNFTEFKDFILSEMQPPPEFFYCVDWHIALVK